MPDRLPDTWVGQDVPPLPERRPYGRWDRPMPEMVELCLVVEMGYTPEEAKRLCITHTDVMVNGILMSTHPRPIAIAVEMAENKAKQ